MRRPESHLPHFRDNRRPIFHHSNNGITHQKTQPKINISKVTLANILAVTLYILQINDVIVRADGKQQRKKIRKSYMTEIILCLLLVSIKIFAQKAHVFFPTDSKTHPSHVRYATRQNK